MEERREGIEKQKMIECQNLYQEQQKKMGCGTICGNEEQVASKSKIIEIKLKKLLVLITPNRYLLSLEFFGHFMKDMQLHPHRYYLHPPSKLQSKSRVSPTVLEKWKILLYGLDFDHPSYVNCLGYPDLEKKDSISNQKNQPRLQPGANPSPPTDWKLQIIQHKCFVQIDKDLDRTFQLTQLQRVDFSWVLKRIANHFPSMGYTQGINFIIGYFIIIGFSDEDAFWLFVHIALNRRFLLLGMFEDKFPLSNVYTIIFKNILKRQHPQLYQHLYTRLCLDESIWVFKWFITFYLYSFPVELCSYIWDYTLAVGSIGLVTFAVSLVTKLAKPLLQIDDPCDASEFFQSLKQVDTFNEYLKLNEVIDDAYRMEVKETDLEGLNNIKDTNGENTFYAEYFQLSFTHEIGQKQSVKTQHNLNTTSSQFWPGKNAEVLLSSWYNRLARERKDFKEKHRKVQSSGQESFIMYLEPTNRTLSQKNQENIKSPQSVQKKTINLDQIKKIESQNKIPETEIDELEDEDEQREREDRYDLHDSLFYLTNEVNLCRKPSQNKMDSNTLQMGMKKVKKYSVNNERSQHQSIENNHMAKIGKSILSSLSVSNGSNCSDHSEKRNSNLGRYCKCMNRAKLEAENSQKQNFRVYKNDTKLECQNHKRKKTMGTELLANSQGPKIAEFIPGDIGTQVEILQGAQMFKKKDKGMGKIMNASERQVSQSGVSRYEFSKQIGEEQSYDSLFIGNISSQKSSIISCEIQSVK